MVADIGGARLYKWVTAVYLAPLVVAAARSAPCSPSSAPDVPISRRCWASPPVAHVCMLAPSMPALPPGEPSGPGRQLLARALGYAVIRCCAAGTAVDAGLGGGGVGDVGVGTWVGHWRWPLPNSVRGVGLRVPCAVPGRAGNRPGPVCATGARQEPSRSGRESHWCLGDPRHGR